MTEKFVGMDKKKVVSGLQAAVGLMVILLVVSMCSSSGEDKEKQKKEEAAMTPAQFVKSLDSGILSSEENKQIANPEKAEPPTYFVEAVLRRDFKWGGAQDWNGLASPVASIAKRAFERNDIARLRIKVVSSSKEDWAYIDYKRRDLPSDWKDLTYLQRFSAAAVDSPYPEGRKALCAFYAQYQSATPKGKEGKKAELMCHRAF